MTQTWRNGEDFARGLRIAHLRTETGSLYEIDFYQKTWARIEPPKRESVAHPLRTSRGTYDEISQPCIGAALRMVCPQYVANASGRYITTSRVVEIAYLPLADLPKDGR